MGGRGKARDTRRTGPDTNDTMMCANNSHAIRKIKLEVQYVGSIRDREAKCARCERDNKADETRGMRRIES